jgi:hypothetical protein
VLGTLITTAWSYFARDGADRKHLRNAGYNVWDLPEIIAVGKFTRARAFEGSDSVVDNTYLRFEVIRVENAAKFLDIRADTNEGLLSWINR